MTGHHDRQRVGRAGGADRADRPGAARQLRDSGVAGGVPVADLGQVSSARYAGTPPRAAGPAAGRSWRRCPAKYSSSSRAAASRRPGALQDPRADPLRQDLQDRVVVLAGVGDADQPSARSRRAAAGRPGCRSSGRPHPGSPSRCAAAASRSCSRLSSRRGAGKARTSSGVRSSMVIGRSYHPCRRTTRRSLAMPSAAARRAASAAPAEDGGDVAVRQPGQVVVGDGLLLAGRQLGQGVGEIAVQVARGGVGGRRCPGRPRPGSRGGRPPV